jgi:hypothetical protein
VKIVLLNEARERFEAEDRWWREHRDAKELFVTEFDEVLRQVAAAPASGQHYRRARGKLIQRILMKKSRCHGVLLLRRGARHYRSSFNLGWPPEAWAQPVGKRAADRTQGIAGIARSADETGARGPMS